MSFEASFNLINDELSYLKKIFEKEINILKKQSEEYFAELNRLRAERELDSQNFEKRVNESRQQSEEYLAELMRMRAEHELERQNWENIRNIFQENIVDLENEIMKATESIPREKELLECIPNMAFICNVNGEISYGNQAFYSFFDLENAETGWFPFGVDALGSAKIRGSWTREMDLTSKNGDEIKVDAKLFSWNNYSGDIGGFVGYTTDRTQLIRAEAEKQKLKQEFDAVNVLLSDEIDSDSKAVRQKELRCVILGDADSGKSTLINSLIGENLLPEGEIINVPVRCARGAEKALIAHYWNGERQSFYRDSVTVECVGKLLAENGLLWLELRSPEAVIPYNIMIEELSEISENVIPKADAFIFLSAIRNYPSFSTLNKIQSLLDEGVYGIFAISKIDLECDDYECGKAVFTVASKIENAIKQIKRILYNFPKLKNCPIVPISSRLKMNLNSIVWHLEEAVSSYQSSLRHSPDVQPLSLPEKDKILPDDSDILAPMLKAFHEQEFQSEFMRFIKSVSGKSDSEKINCLFISPHRESVNKLIARLAHDISYMYALNGTENDWTANFDDTKYTKISVPDSILAKINFIITPEVFHADINEDEWDTVFKEYTPVLVLELTGKDYGSEWFENSTCKHLENALRKKGFCIVSGEGLMINSTETVSQKINDWAGRNIPLFIYENYEVMMRSAAHE